MGTAELLKEKRDELLRIAALIRTNRGTQLKVIKHQINLILFKDVRKMKIRMKNCIIAGFMLMCILLFSEIITVNAQLEPTLLWQHEFERSIDSVVMSANGERIVVTTQIDGDDGTGGNAFWVFDRNGNILWEYEKEGMYLFRRPQISDDGNRIAIPQLDGWWYEYGTDDLTGEMLKEFDYAISKIFVFDGEGNILWERESSGYPIMSDDGNYIITINPMIKGEPIDQYNCYFDKDGNLLWKVSAPGGESAAITSDGSYVLIGPTLYDRSGNIIWKKEEYERFRVDISSMGNYIAFILPYIRGRGCEFPKNKSKVFDKAGNLLWERCGEKYSISFSYNENYLAYYAYPNFSGSFDLYDMQGNLLWSKTSTPIFKCCRDVVITNNEKYIYLNYEKVNATGETNDFLGLLSVNGDLISEKSVDYIDDIVISDDGKYILIKSDNLILFYDNSTTIGNP